MNDKKNLISQEDFLKFFNLENKDIEEFNVYWADDGLHVAVTLEKAACKCPNCLNWTSKVKGYHNKMITHSILTNTPCFIDYRARRMQCRKCGKTFYEDNPFSVGGSRISLLTVYNILEDLRKPTMTFKDAAERYHVSQTTVANIFDSHVSISRRPLPEVICIDEVYAFKSSYGKYICVLVDFKTQNVIDVLPSRKKHDLEAYFSSIPLSERNNVKMISSDLYETYRQITKSMFPNSGVSADHYHVAHEFGKKLERVRIDAMNQYGNRKKYLLKKQKDYKKLHPDDNSNHPGLTPQEYEELTEATRHYYVLKKFNWMFFSNSDRIFDPNEKKKYNKVLKGYYNYYDIYDIMVKQDRILDIAYDLKYELDEFYKNSDSSNAKERLSELIAQFNKSPIKEMNDFGKTLSRWKYEIINSFTRFDGKRVSNGIIENRNKVIKLIKHSSNGYLNWERYRNRILYCLNKDAVYRMYPIKNNTKK